MTTTRKQWDDEIKQSGGHLGGAWTPYVSSSYCPDLIRWFMSVFPIRNVVDLGCGSGETLRSFRTNGATVLGIEGMETAARLCDVPVLVHDFEKGPVRLANVDLIFSMEFVEHVANERAVIKTLCSGKMVCISHAQPGQGGHNHVNCQTGEHWIDLMLDQGYVYLEEMSEQHVRRYAHGTYMGTTGLLFVRKDVDWGLWNDCYKARWKGEWKRE